MNTGRLEERARIGRPKKRDAAATRSRLLRAAEVEFAAQGYQGARLRNIARAADVQPALIHHYFDDKQGLFRSMLDAALSESSTESWRILEGDEDDFAAVANAFVTMMLSFNRRNQNLLTILRHEATTGSRASGVTQEIVGSLLAPVVEAVIRFIEQRQKLGEVRAELAPADVVMTALALTSYPFVERAFLETCIPSGLVETDADLERRRAAIVDALMRYAAA